MPIRALLVLILTLVAVAAAALPAGAQQDLPPATPAASIADGSAQRALDQARARWNRLKIRNYDYEVMVTCFCPYTGWVLVKVRNGVPSKRSQAAAGDLATVPRLFREIRQAIDGPAHRLDVHYGARGVPVDVFTDPIQFAVDDENGFGTRRFKRR
jgi:hypothetical protein